MNSAIRLHNEAEAGPYVQRELPDCNFAKLPSFCLELLTPEEYKTLGALEEFRYLEKDALCISRSRQQIADRAGVSAKTISRRLKILEAKKLIFVQRFKDNSFLIHFLYVNAKDSAKTTPTNHSSFWTPSGQQCPDPLDSSVHTLGTPVSTPSGHQCPDPYRARTRDSRVNSKKQEKEKQNAREIVDVGHGSPSTTPAKTKDQNADRDGLPLFRPRAETPETPPGEPARPATLDYPARPGNAPETTPDVDTSPPPPAIAAPDSGPAAAIAGTSERPNDAMAEPYPLPSGPPWPPPSRVHLLRPGLFAHYRTLSLESNDPKDIREARIRLWLHDQAVRHELAGGALSDTIQMELLR